VFAVPVGRVVVVIWIGVGAGALMDRPSVPLTAVWGEVAESVTLTAMEKAPLAVGVPLTTPDVARFIPAGSEPEARVQVYGGVPPVADSVALYVVFTVPEGSAVVVIWIGVGVRVAGALMDRLNVPLTAVWGEVAESVAWTVKEKVPLALGVPLMTPELESVRPAGSEPEARLHV
jgi:hypothetical protein